MPRAGSASRPMRRSPRPPAAPGRPSPRRSRSSRTPESSHGFRGSSGRASAAETYWGANGWRWRVLRTSNGPIEVQRPKARDRAAASGERVRFTSNILPKWARRTRSLDALLPVLYLRGISAGDFQEALAALLGKDAPNLSAAVIARLKSEWEEEYRRWQKRDLSARHYVYVWADGVYLQARMDRRP